MKLREILLLKKSFYKPVLLCKFCIWTLTLSAGSDVDQIMVSNSRQTNLSSHIVFFHFNSYNRSTRLPPRFCCSPIKPFSRSPLNQCLLDIIDEIIPSLGSSAIRQEHVLPHLSHYSQHTYRRNYNASIGTLVHDDAVARRSQR